MRNTFVLNGKEIVAREFDVNLMCDLEDLGISLLNNDFSSNKIFPIIRAYLACCLNSDLKTAGNELQSHMLNGGSLDDISNAFTKAMEDSDFFRALSQTEESSASKSKAKATK